MLRLTIAKYYTNVQKTCTDDFLVLSNDTKCVPKRIDLSQILFRYFGLSERILMTSNLGNTNYWEVQISTDKYMLLTLQCGPKLKC